MLEGEEIDLDFWAEKDIDLYKVIWSETQSQVLCHQKIFMKMGKLKVAKTKLDKLNFFELKDLKTIAVSRIVSRWWEK